MITRFKLTLLLAFFPASLLFAQVKKPVAKAPAAKAPAAKTATVKKPAAATASPAASILRGKTVYATYCLACHQVDGGGVPNLNPPLSKTVYVSGDKNRLIRILLKGFSQEIEINGSYYSNAMPAFDYLKDQEIADVLTYVRNNFGNKYPAITPLNVKAAR